MTQNSQSGFTTKGSAAADLQLKSKWPSFITPALTLGENCTLNTGKIWVTECNTTGIIMRSHGHVHKSAFCSSKCHRSAADCNNTVAYRVTSCLYLRRGSRHPASYCGFFIKATFFKVEILPRTEDEEARNLFLIKVQWCLHYKASAVFTPGEWGVCGVGHPCWWILYMNVETQEQREGEAFWEDDEVVWNALSRWASSPLKEPSPPRASGGNHLYGSVKCCHSVKAAGVSHLWVTAIVSLPTITYGCF